MSDNSHVIGEVTVEVKAGLTLDEHTFHTCMSLAAIHGYNQGLEGMVVIFNDAYANGYVIVPLETEEEVDAAISAKSHCQDVKEGKNV